MPSSISRRRVFVAPGLAILFVLTSMMPAASGTSTRTPGPHGPVPEPFPIEAAPPDLPPGAVAPPAVDASLKPFDGSNEVKALTDAGARNVESLGGRVIENQDGLVVIEVRDEDGQPVRIAALNEHTDLGTDVIGLAFLGPAEIAELEAMDAADTALLGPATAAAHYQGLSHYHYFYNCSWIFNQGGTYAMSWYMCPDDTWNDRFLGYIIAGILGLTPGTGSLVRWIGGMLVGGAEWYFYASDGSLRGSMSDWRSVCGWVLWNSGPTANHWMYYYCAGSIYFNQGRDDYWNKFFYVKYP